MLAILIALTALGPLGAFAEAPELNSEPEQIILEDDALELPEDYAQPDLSLDDGLVLDDLQLLDLDLTDGGGKEHRAAGESAEPSGEDVSDPEADSSNATKYGVPTALSLGLKEKYAIKCTKTGKLTYKTSNKKVATVSSKGVVIGKKAGTATITVSLKGKKLTACKVKVVAAPKKVTLSNTSLTMNVNDTFKLKAKVNSGSHASYTWASSNKSVATVSKAGLVTAVGAGSATITVKTHNGKKATCAVTVNNPGPTLFVTPQSMTIEEGNWQDATVTYTVEGTAHWESSDTNVATCAWTSGWYGNDTTLTVYGHSAGSATITITNSANSDVVYLYVTVIPPEKEETPEETGYDDIVTVSPTEVSMTAGESRDTTVTFNAKGTVTWSSSDENIATCAWTSDWFDGNSKTILTVYGKSAGSATITITNDVNSDTASIDVTVAQAPTPETPTPEAPTPETEGGDSSVKYRALLIGEEAFDPICTRNRGDVTLMNNMLSSVRGPAGGQYSITRQYDLSLTGVRNAISSAFSGADDDDVSLFFIASHGDSTSTGGDAGAISLIGSSYDEQWLLISDLANALKAVPGKVIVIIETCGSGAAVYSPGISENQYNTVRNAATSFDAEVIRAFSEADPGIRVRVPGRTNTKGAPTPNTGELRVENKFYVLTASRYLEESWGTEKGPYNYFTKWLTDGIGTSGSMAADADANGEATLSELFNYVAKRGNDYPFEYDGTIYYQHVQVYPKDSDYGLFRR
jgi:uncharacterized protein YjdB